MWSAFEWLGSSELLHLSAAALVLSEFDWKRLWFKPVVALLENVVLVSLLGLGFDYLAPVGIRPLIPFLVALFLGIFFQRPSEAERGRYRPSRWERLFSRIGTLVSMGWNIGSLLLSDKSSALFPQETEHSTSKPPESRPSKAEEKSSDFRTQTAGFADMMQPLLNSFLSSPAIKEFLGADQGSSGSTPDLPTSTGIPAPSSPAPVSDAVERKRAVYFD